MRKETGLPAYLGSAFQWVRRQRFGVDARGMMILGVFTPAQHVTPYTSAPLGIPWKCNWGHLGASDQDWLGFPTPEAWNSPGIHPKTRIPRSETCASGDTVCNGDISAVADQNSRQRSTALGFMLRLAGCCSYAMSVVSSRGKSQKLSYRNCWIR
jgi:hypothetical protein